MKLAEALILRADQQKRLQQLRARLSSAVKVQEGEEPPEDPNELIEEYMDLSEELTELIQKINRANEEHEVESGLTINQALAKRDDLLRKQQMLRNAVENARIQQNRYSKSEVKYVRTVDVEKLQKQADKLAKEHRELDSKIQEANWNVDIEV